MNALLIVILALAVLYGLLMLTYFYAWRQLRVFNPSPQVNRAATRVSVIIPARDEAANLPALLQALQRQTYDPAYFEVIVIDDFSQDATADVVRNFPAANVKLLRLEDHLNKEQRLNSYKKKAIELAIEQATGDLIMTTDADCVMDEKWIETFVHCYETHRPKFIAAPVSFYKEDNFFKQLQSLDFMTMQGITGAMAYLKSGTMCNGANLAYEKQAFYDVGGFMGIDMIASGDDMLLMYKIYHAYPDGVMYIKSKEAIVRTLPVDDFSSFMHQRIRWSSKADKYEDTRITRVLVLVYFWNLALVVMALTAIFIPALWWWLLWIMVYKTAIELLFLTPVAKFFGKEGLLPSFIPGQPFHILYVIVAGWLGKFGSYQWKGRTVK